ncbi:hypothetical protein BH10PLA1_BH10PLA1_07080 [soil metagenome]
MSKGQKVLTTVLWAVLVLAMVGVISAGLFLPGNRSLARNRAESPDGLVTGVRIEAPVLNIDAPEFSLIDQDGKPVSTHSLKGSVWIAEFIFTHCAGPCRDMSARFSQMQKEITDPDVKFVSISVDPDRDTPDALKKYSEEFTAKPGRWSFLTGDKTTVYSTARGMLVSVNPETDNTPLVHDQRFVLVDAAGKIRASADRRDEAALAKLIADATTYAAEARKAAAAK